MLAQNNNVFEETCEAVCKLNQDQEARYICEMHEEGQRILRTYQNMLKEKETAPAEKDAIIASLQAQIEAQKK